MVSFSDDFNRPDTTDLGVGWVEVSGDWSIISGQLATGSTGGTIILRAAGAMATDDNSAQATIAATATASMGVWCRGNETISAGYLWRNDGATWDLFSVVSGTFNIIGTYATPAAPGDVAKVQAVGSTIRGFVNGVERVSVTDTAVPTGVYVGIRSQSVAEVRYDDFTGADVTAGATLNAAAETDAAQPLAATKAAALDPAGAQDTAQALPGAKVASLGAATVSEEALPLIAAKAAALGRASVDATALPLTGAKAGTLGTAVEADAARPLATPAADDDVDIAFGGPYSPWSVGGPRGSGWEVATPA